MHHTKSIRLIEVCKWRNYREGEISYYYATWNVFSWFNNMYIYTVEPGLRETRLIRTADNFSYPLQLHIHFTVYLCMCMCVYMCMCMYMYVYIYTYIYVYKCVYVCIYTVNLSFSNFVNLASKYISIYSNFNKFSI